MVNARTLFVSVIVFSLAYIIQATFAFASRRTTHHHSIAPVVTPPQQRPFRISQHNQRRSYSKSHQTIRKMLDFPRGGAIASAAAESSNNVLGKIAQLGQTPTGVFNAGLVTLGLTTILIKIWQRIHYYQEIKKEASAATKKPKVIQSLQIRFLLVFWLLRCADWLQGPYFYEVYASKVFHGVPASLGLVSKLFLTGFASTALFGPYVGRATDAYGRKKGTLAFSILYALGAASTKSPFLGVLFIGRMLSGIGTSLLFSAPESWLVGEAQRSGEDMDGAYLGETFGMAYAGDSVVAILAGQFAGAAADARGPTGPFELSVGFLLAGGLLASLLWRENIAEATNGDDQKPTIQEAVAVVRKDPKIMLVGAVQSLFEAAMYIFVLQWPPAISRAISNAFGTDVVTPYGTVFSCLMAACLLGSTLFGQLARMTVSTEASSAAMLTIATLSMGASALAVTSPSTSLAAIVAAFFAFEACVGMYFPSIGTLRSKYVPDSHRSVIMNLFGIPLNVLVVSVFLSIRSLGVGGALSISTAALGLATACMYRLLPMSKERKAAMA